MAARRTGRALSLNQLLGGTVGLLAICLALMIGVVADSVHVAGRYLLRVGYSQDQLLLANRINADAARPMLDRAAIDRDVAAYIRSIDEEAGTTSDQAAQSEERRVALRLQQLLARPDPDRAAVAGLVAEISRRERAEVAAVVQDMKRLRMRSLGSSLLLALFAVAMLSGIGWILSRAIIQPVRRIGRAAAALAREERCLPIPSGGIVELRILADGFNDMAAQIEAQVRTRTSELEAGNRRLADIDASRRLFLAKVGHELRTPVTVMRGEADVALRNPRADAGTLREALEHISANGGFLQRRLDDLLGLSRSADGRLPLERRKVDLAQVVERAVAIAAPFARSSEVRIAWDINALLPPIDGDAERLTQALLALLDNAVKFAGPEGGIALRLSADHRHAVVTVTDSGPGVAEAELVRLFDPYFQTAMGHDRGGTGLGLALVRWIVDQHGGSIEARNGEAGGLRVVLRLPFAAGLSVAA